MSAPLIDTDDKEGFSLKVTWSLGFFKIVVVSPAGIIKEERFFGQFEPRFGIDVADLQQIQSIAERLVVELGATPAP